MKKLFDPNKDYSGILSSIVAIVIGLLVGFIVLLALKPSKAVEAFGLLITGGFYSGLKTFGNVLYYATPLIICGLGTGVAFKASIFNIGGPGQMHMGAFVAIYTAVKWNLPGPLGWLVPLIMSMVAGALLAGGTPARDGRGYTGRRAIICLPLVLTRDKMQCVARFYAHTSCLCPGGDRKYCA